MKPSDEIVPCKDCITLPICRLKVINKEDKQFALVWLARIKCFLLYNYIASNDIHEKGNVIYKPFKWKNVSEAVRYMTNYD